MANIWQHQDNKITNNLWITTDTHVFSLEQLMLLDTSNDFDMQSMYTVYMF